MLLENDVIARKDMTITKKNKTMDPMMDLKHLSIGQDNMPMNAVKWKKPLNG